MTHDRETAETVRKRTIEDLQAERNLNIADLLKYWREQADACGDELDRLEVDCEGDGDSDTPEMIAARNRWEHVRDKWIETENRCRAAGIKVGPAQEENETPQPETAISKKFLTKEEKKLFSALKDLSRHPPDERPLRITEYSKELGLSVAHISGCLAFYLQGVLHEQQHGKGGKGANDNAAKKALQSYTR